MSRETLGLSEELLTYVRDVSVRESSALTQLREATAALPMAMMQISPEQGQFMALLVRLLGARRCLEVGTFTGYSAMACAQALPEDGHVLTLDVNAEWTSIARRHWQAAGVDQRIELRLGPAAESLNDLLNAGEANSYDFMFIDADKPGYRHYCELGLQLVRPGGLIAVDNVLWSGRVIESGATDEDSVAIRDFNGWLASQSQLDISLVPIGDGLTLIRKPD